MKNCKKKILCGFLAGAVLFASGCGNKDTQDQAKVQRYAWPLGSSSPEDTVTQIYAEKFAEEVERLSGGMMLISVYPNSVLGGDRELLESCKEGDIPFVVQNTAPQVTFMPDVAVFDMPAVFETIDEVREHVDNPDFLSMMQQVYGDAGYVLLEGRRIEDVKRFYKNVVGGRAGVTEYYMYDATNIRLRELSLSYRLPANWIQQMKIFHEIQLSFVGRNLFFFYKKAPFDPDLVLSTGNDNQGIDVYGMPTTRSLGFSIKCDF